MSKLDPEIIFNPSELFIHTPMLDKLEKQLHHWLRTGLTGGLVLGKYRTGKTRAIEYISNRLENRKGEKIPTNRITISQKDVSTVASIFRNLCFALDIPIKHRTNADDMANYLTHYFGEQAIQNSTKQVVLIVDEMQRLKVNQINAFAELYDNLSIAKLNMSVFFVGNLGSSQPLLETISQDQYELIRGRFFTHVFDFSGISRRTDV
ncbi:ATP-binding protein [Aliikangiella sp. IMCC44359]|uniref:ATP-binding protein n=1 Tax=Aliikangiella sp. IMCC44359 TaxID=3459125 RepID=UPI00403AA97D